MSHKQHYENGRAAVYYEGRSAFLAGQSLMDNPHPDGSRAEDEWDMGFADEWDEQNEVVEILAYGRSRFGPAI